MKKRMSTIAILVASSLFRSASAQDACTALINHGIYDFGRNSNSGATATTIQSSVCSAYTYLSSHGGTSSGGFNILDFGGGSASISDSSLLAVGNSFCDNKAFTGNTSSLYQSFSQVIDRGILDAYTQCLQISTNGLSVNSDFDEVYSSRVGISLRYTPPAGVTASTIKVTGINIGSSLDPDPSHRVTCSGPLWSGTQGGSFSLGSSFVGMDCQRYVVADPKNAFLIAGKPKLAAPVTITVFTDAGDVVRTLAELSVPPATSTVPAIVYNIGAQTIGAGQDAILNFSRPEVDTTGGAVTVGPNWGFRAPVTGVYQITVSAGTNEALDGAVAMELLRVPVSGTTLALPKGDLPGAFILDIDYGYSNLNYNRYLGNAAYARLNAGDTVQVFYQNRLSRPITFLWGRIGIVYQRPCTVSPDGTTCQ